MTASGMVSGQKDSQPTTSAARDRLIKRIFPQAIPTLWCPPLTHFDERGNVDPVRMAAHLQHMAPYVKGLLVPGSTGDGWVLSSAERQQVLEVAIEQARRLELKILIGALKASSTEVLATIRNDVTWLIERAGEKDTAKAMARDNVCGFTICPPCGKDQSQEEIRRALKAALDLGLPTALYQLPQVTQNEISPELAAELAAQFPNFIFLKDSSGADRIMQAGHDLGGVFAARGGEGNYERWLKRAGGPYDGFLLGSANCFAREESQIIQDVRAGHTDTARELSTRVTEVVRGVASLARQLSKGLAFAHANKAIDHFFAHGPRAASVPPPRLHEGNHLPAEIIGKTGELLTANMLMPERGYLE